MENVSNYVAALFGITVLLSLWIFSKTTVGARPFLLSIIAITIIQSALGLTGFYHAPGSMTSRFPLLVMPLTIVGIVLFLTTKGRAFIDSLDIKTLTILHTVRIPVELTLFWLFAAHTIPQAMTFEGRNFDILSGLTAPLIYYSGFVRNKLNRVLLIVWNVACILLLLNVVASAILSLPARYQHFGFEQPNIAVGYFPFLLLPAVLVPLVLFANAAAIRQLILNKVSTK